MNNFKIEIDFVSCNLQIDGIYYHFNYGKLTSDKGDDSYYTIIKNGGEYYLRTGIEIIKGTKEIPINLILNKQFIMINDK